MTTKVFCYFQIYLKILWCNQSRPWSDCSHRNSLIRFNTGWLHLLFKSICDIKRWRSQLIWIYTVVTGYRLYIYKIMWKQYRSWSATCEEASCSGSTLYFLSLDCANSVWDGNKDPDQPPLKKQADLDLHSISWLATYEEASRSRSTL